MPQVVDAVRGRDGTSVVTVKGLQVNSAPQYYSFTLRRVGSEWFIVFDTLLESGITAYVKFRNTPNPNAKKAPAAAERAGLAAARSYRVAFQCRAGQDGTGVVAPPPIEASTEC